MEMFEAPVERVPENPVEWITTEGPVTWVQIRRLSSSVKCEDCLHLIADYLDGRQACTRPPGLARLAAFRRRQDGTETLHCVAHKGWRDREEKCSG